jgi:hypothetical protein
MNGSSTVVYDRHGNAVVTMTSSYSGTYNNSGQFIVNKASGRPRPVLCPQCGRDMKLCQNICVEISTRPETTRR